MQVVAIREDFSQQKTWPTLQMALSFQIQGMAPHLGTKGCCWQIPLLKVLASMQTNFFHPGPLLG